MGQPAQQIKLLANEVVGMVEDSEQKAAATLGSGAKLLQSGKALLMKGVDKLKGMLTPKVKFRLGSEEHELWVVKGSTRNIVMMASGEGEEVWKNEKVIREIKENPNLG